MLSSYVCRSGDTSVVSPPQSGTAGYDWAKSAANQIEPARRLRRIRDSFEPVAVARGLRVHGSGLVCVFRVGSFGVRGNPGVDTRGGVGMATNHGDRFSQRLRSST